MARAYRHYIPGHIWHITHRCHKREFLLKFSKDRLRWLQWLYEARKRYGLKILDYTVTSNHIHLLAYDATGNDVLSRSMQLVAGRTGQEYNQRKKRKGAFWEDRYHAAIIEGGEHLLRCIVYIDMNMVRAGVVDHPERWMHAGFRAKGRDIIEGAEEFQVREGEAVYNAFFNAEKSNIDLQNTYFWNTND